MPAHRIPFDLQLENCKFPTNWRGFWLYGVTLPLLRTSAGAPTGTPNAQWCFDTTNGILYCGVSGSWVAQTAGASGGTVPAANFATDTLTVNSLKVEPYTEVRYSVYSNGAGSSEIQTNGGGSALFVADRAYTIVSCRAWISTATGAGTVRVWKTTSGTAFASGTAVTGATDLSALTISTLNTIALSATTLAAGDVLGVVVGTSPSGTGCAQLIIRLVPA